MPKYKVNGRTFNIPDNEVDLFEADFPEAQLHYQTNDGRKFTIYANERKDFLSDFPDANELGWGETIKEQAKQADPFQSEDNLAQPMFGSMSYQDNIGKPEDYQYYPSPLNEEGRAETQPLSPEERSKQEYEMLMGHLKDFDNNNGDFMDTYEAYEKAAKHQINEGGFAIDTFERRYLDENSNEYHQRKKEKDELNARIKSNSYFNQMRMTEADAANETVDAISNLMAQNEAENSELHKKMQAMNALSMNPRGSFSGFAKTKEMQEYMDERADLETAKRLYENTAQVYAAPINDGEDILKKFGQGFGQRVDDADFWTMGIIGIADDMNARAAFQKIQDKLGSVKELANLTDAEIDALLTPSEQLLISAVMDNNAAQYARMDNTSGAYQAGAGAADSLMFMAQFLLTGGIGEAATVGTAAHRRLVSWLGRKVGSMSNGLMKDVARGAVKLGVGTAESIGKALVMTPLMPHTYANIADKMMSFDDNGELMDTTDAIISGSIDALIETWSESTGDFVNKILGIPGNITKGVAKKVLKNVDFSDWGKAMNAPMMKILKKGGFNGFLGEMGEEFIGNATRSLVGTLAPGSGQDPEALKNFAQWEQLLITAGSFAPMTIFGLGVSSAQYGWQKRQLNNAQKAFESILREASYTEDQARFIVDELLGSTDANLTPEKLVANFSPLLKELAFNDRFANNRTQAMQSAVDFMLQIARYRTFDGVYHRQEEQQRNDMLAEIQEGTGREFWTTRLSENAGLDGTAYETDEVRAVEFNDGRVAYVLGSDGTTNTVVYNDGQTGFLSEEQLNEGKANGSIVSDATMGLNDYLTQQVARVRMTEEEQRMFAERNTNIGAIRAQFPIDATVELGTTEAPIQGVVRQQTPDGVIVESPAGISQLTWEELGHTMGLEVNPQTDSQMEEEAINNLEIADLQRRRAREQRRTQRNTAAEAALAEEQMLDEAENEGLEKPIPMKADGTVDQTAFWNESPARWAQWKTEQRQDGGAYASSYIQNAIGILEGQIAESEAAFLAESDFDAKDALEQAINQQRARLAELQDLSMQYMPSVIPAETSVEATAEQTQPSEETAQPAAVMAERQKFELDAEYQRRLSLAKTLAEKEMILKEYFEAISAGSMEAVVMNKQNYKQIMKDNGCDEAAIEEVTNAIKESEEENTAVNALHVNDKIFVIAEYNYTVEQGRVSYVHERQHNITKRNPELIQRVLSLGLSRETLQKIVRTLSGTTFYDNESDEVLADEILSSTMEIAYTFDDFSVTLSKLGLPIELINLINEINDEQRNDFTLANARRNTLPRNDRQGSSRQDVGDQGEVSGGILGEEGNGSQETGLRRTESGEPTTGGAEASEEGLQVPVAEVDEESEEDAETILNEDGFEVDEQNEDVRFSVRYVPTPEQRESVIDSIIQTTGRTREKAERWLESELSLVPIVLNDKEYLDYAPDSKYKAIKDNSDYPQGTVDFNNICRKRKDFTRMYTRLQRAYPNRIFTAEDLADIRTIMSEDGLVVACGLCYVEDRRQKLGEVADEFIKDLQDGFKSYGKKNATKRANAEKFRSLVGEDTYVPSIYDLITLEGSDKLHDEHKGIWDAFGAYNRARGQQTQNTFQGYAEYKREILTWSDAKVKKVNSLGGLRIFSYSDFEAHHLLDIIQIIIDCAARGVMIQGYTKVPEFARVVEKTGIKLNRSLIPLGDTGIVDGKLAYDPVEGIDINDPNFLESNDNVGNILIGINDEQIRMAMADPFIHYIIPYHARQAGNIRAKLNVGAWSNYIDTQNERKMSDGKRVEKNINIYTDVLNESITNDKEFVEKYLEVCREKGYIPKFDQFLDKDAEGNYVYTPGYHKFLVDFKLFDEAGNILPQKAVVAEFDDEFNAQVLKDYGKEERENVGETMNSTYDKIVETLDLGEPTEGEDVRFKVSEGVIDLVEEARKADLRHRVVAEGTLVPGHKKGQPMLSDAEMMADVSFRITKNTKATIETWFNKAGVDPEMTEATINYLDFAFEDTTEQLCAAKWYLNGKISLPDEDEYKVRDAVKVAKQNKVDALSYASPMDILNTFGQPKSKVKPINPDTIKEFSNKNELAEGIVVYDVQDDFEGQAAVRKIIDTHWGEDANPWCLAARVNGDLNRAKEMWQYYSKYPKRIAFRNGKLLAFYASAKDKTWWDRNDEPHTNIPYSVKSKEGEYEVSTNYELKEGNKKAKKVSVGKSDKKGRTAYYVGNRLESAGIQDGERNLFYSSYSMGATLSDSTYGVGRSIEIQYGPYKNVTQISFERRAKNEPTSYVRVGYGNNGVRAISFVEGARSWDIRYGINGDQIFVGGAQLNFDLTDELSNVYSGAYHMYRINDEEYEIARGRKKVGIVKKGEKVTMQMLEAFGEDGAPAGALLDFINDMGWNRSDYPYPNPMDADLLRRDDEVREQIRKVENEINEIAGGRYLSSVPAIRFRVTAEQDKAYMDAVEAGDMETAQRMVDAAARAAGYDSPKLYHGTKNFGFTKVDVSKSDDGISFFTTNNPSIAKTYSSVGGERRINEPVDEEARKAMAASLYDDAQDYLLEYTSNLSEWLRIEERGLDIEDFSTKVTDIVYDIVDKVEKGQTPPMTAVGEMAAAWDDVIEEYYDRERYASSNEQLADDDGTWKNRIEVARAFFKYFQAISNPKSVGNYSFYASTVGMKTIECNGSNWNNIRSSDLPNNEPWKPWTTRKVARYLKEEGFKGVIFKNIIDLGGHAGIPEVEWKSDIYDFFEPSWQVKSADPVTYDDQGNVIPLSERFNPEKSDIRFRTVRTDEQRDQLFDKAKEHYGLTNNFNASGYMLPDGSLLDFSEANDGGDPNRRSLDHRDIEGIIMDNGVEYDSRWMYIADFMNEGAIRILPESAGINMIQAPTEEQRKKIFDFIYKYNGEVILEINDERLNSIVYMEYDRRTSPSRIFRDIDGYFNDGVVPQQDVRFRVLDTTNAELKEKPIKLNGMYRFKLKNAFKGVKDNGGSYPYIKVQLEEVPEDHSGDKITYNGILEGFAVVRIPKGLITEGEKDNVFFIDPKDIEKELWDVLRATENYYEFKHGGAPYQRDWLNGEDVRFRMSNENQAIFVSNAAKAVDGIKQEKATPEQWLKMIEKNGGLKAGEDKWMGLSDWLKASDKKTLTKQEVLEFTNENMIVIEEVHYAAGAEDDAENTYAMIERILQEKFGKYIAEYYEQNSGEDDDLYGGDSYEYAMDKLREEMNDEFPYTIERSNSVVYLTFPYEETDDLQEWADKLGIKFAPQNPINYTRLDYTTDGLNNKHEIALTVPTIEPWNEGDEIHFGDAGDGRAVAWVRFGETYINEEADAAYEQARKDEQDFRTEMEQKYGSLANGMRSTLTEEEYAHYMRLVDRTIQLNESRKTAKEKKVLVIDEIQSKRHQEGREKGYKKEEGSDIEIIDDGVVIEARYNGRSYFFSRGTSRTTIESSIGYDTSLANRDGIPDAPFDKNWHELAMKRMLRYAAENGYDVIAWTKGDQQAERYNIGNVVEYIDVAPYEAENSSEVNGFDVSIATGGVATLDLYVTESGEITSGQYGPENLVGKQLSDVVGKDLAAKILSTDRSENSVRYEGDDFRIGGEGMKGFYDKMLPAFMNKYGKKWGVKVEDIDLPNLENGLTMHSIPVTEEMKDSVMEGQVMFRMRGENESAKEFTDSIVKDFKDDYNAAAPIEIVDLNSKEDVARFFNIPAEDITDDDIQFIKNDVEKKDIWAAYHPDLKKIVIFVRDSLTDSKKGELALIHENIHAINDKYPEFLALGEYLWNRVEEGTKEHKYKTAIQKFYPEHKWHDELSAYVVSEHMQNGTLDELRYILDLEHTNILNKILNTSGYGKERKSDRAGFFRNVLRKRSSGKVGRASEKKGGASELTAEERRIINEYFPGAFPEEENDTQSDNTGEFSEGEGDIRFSIRTKPAPKKTGKGYKVFYLKDGKLYPPMVANQGGVDTPVGVWLDAEEGTRAGESKTGRPKVKQGGKGTQGGSGTLAYRPGWHLGEIPYALQFNRKDENGEKALFPANFVWAEVEYANDIDYQEEAMSYGYTAKGKFQHSLAGLPKLPTDGSYRYRTNPNPETDPWIITGAMKVKRLLTPSEVDQMVIDAGREPQKRQEGAVTDAQIEALNKELGLVEEEEEVSFRVTGTPTDEVVANGLQLTPAQTAEVAANIFAALPEESRKKITEGLNGNILGLKDAILQIPTSLASKENWNEVDRAMADVVAEEMTKMAGEMTRPFSAEEGLWLLYNNLNKGTDLISQASRALVQRNLGFDAETLAKQEQAKEDVRFRTVGDASSNAEASLYNRGAANVWTRLKESYVDMMASVEELVKAIEKRTGKVAQGFENILLALNQQSSKGLAAMESYERRFLNPMFDEIRRIMDETKMKYEDVVRYVILKHGLERNKKLAQRDARAHYQEIYDDIISKITGMTAAQKRTYLTNAQLKEGDAKAELATLQAVDMSAMTDEEKREHKKKLAAARKAAEEAEEHLKRAQKIASMSEQEAQDELDKIFEKIENGTDSVFKEMRENDYSGISSMFYDQLGVDRKNFSTEEQYQAALMEAKKDRYSSLKDVEAAAEAEVKSFEGKTDTKELWKRINAATKETLRQQYEANMISKDQYLNLRDMFEYYVPLRGFKDNTAEDMYTYYRKPNSTGYTKPILGAEGRKTEAESPFGWIAAMAGSAIASNVKNEAKLALYYFVSNRPENGIATISKTWFVDSGEVDERGKKIFKPAYPPFSEDLSSAEGKAQYEIWQANMKELQKKGQAYEAGQRLNLGNAVVNISDANKPEHIVNVKVGGKDYTIIINGNPRAAQAINGDLNIEGTAQDYSALFGPVLRWMSSVNTSYNPEFWITNMMRDVAFTWMAVNTKEEPAYRRKFWKNYLKAFKVISLVAKNEKGTIGDSYLEQQYKDFVKYGGVTGYTQIKDSETWEKEIDNYLSSKDPKSVKNGKVMRGMKSAFHVAHRFGESLEQVSRFAAFLTARETGKSINEAINDAKEITVNFNRKGSGKMITLEEAKYLTGKNGQPLTKPQQWMVVGLSSIAPLGRRFIMFFNAAIQGLNATYKLMKKNPKRFTGWALGYAAVGMMNAVLHAMLDDDDDYLDIPQYERRNSLMIGGNGAYFKWALPQEARAFYALGDLAVETVMGRNPHQNFLGEALKIGTEILPVNPSEGWKAFMPSVAIPFIELALNEDYKGAPIYNEQKWLSEEEKERTAKWSNAYQGTGWTYVKIAQGLNFITGGDKHDAGWINLQPEKLEHLVQSAFGGTIRTADKFINTISAALDPDEPVTVRQFPFVNRFLTINDERFKNVHVNDVFDYYKADAEHALTLEKQYTKDRDKESLTELRSSDEYRWAKIYGKYKKPLKAIQDKIKVADGTTEKKDLMKQQDELKKRMIKEISEL